LEIFITPLSTPEGNPLSSGARNLVFEIEDALCDAVGQVMAAERAVSAH
jgi:hypothetical protein